ncbi:hypothetical protein [Pseudomonas vanderleydeniana]|uniref:Uncharacterized protein n=1 Tax=Pseudomonas vanderleydeniana TaxID=2745495 RepID=A0A9E6TRV8_9PSED|nr:hypothetical protein [Pseudomonas vanderleydeniana]QXI28274.1 hypothetical protein HU752_031075 [Pseudomonas vanderleydeniana]
MQENPEDDGVIRFKRLHPEQIDVVLGTHPSKQRAPRRLRRKSHSLRILLLLLVGMLGYMAYNRSSYRPPQTPPASEPATPVAAEPSVLPEVVDPAQSPGTPAQG